MPRVGKEWRKGLTPRAGDGGSYNAEISRNDSTNSTLIFNNHRGCHGAVLDGIVRFGVLLDTDTCRDEP